MLITNLIPRWERVVTITIMLGNLRGCEVPSEKPLVLLVSKRRYFCAVCISKRRCFFSRAQN